MLFQAKLVTTLAKSFITFANSNLCFDKTISKILKFQFIIEIISASQNIFYSSMHIAKNIRFLRKSKGWNQSKLGELVEISNATVSSYESGINQPGIDTVAKLAMAFKVSVDDLLFRDIEKQGTSNKPAPTSAKISDEEVMQLNELMMHRIRELEREIKMENPELARKLGIK